MPVALQVQLLGSNKAYAEARYQYAIPQPTSATVMKRFDFAVAIILLWWVLHALPTDQGSEIRRTFNSGPDSGSWHLGFCEHSPIATSLLYQCSCELRTRAMAETGVNSCNRSLSHAQYLVSVPQGCTAAMQSRCRSGLGVGGFVSARRSWTSHSNARNPSYARQGEHPGGVFMQFLGGPCSRFVAETAQRGT